MLLPLQGDYSMVLLTRGDADALPRAECFWAFSPRVKRNKTLPILPLHRYARIAECTPHAMQGQPAHSPTTEATRGADF